MSKNKFNEKIELDSNSVAIPVNPSGEGNTIGTNAYIQVLDDSSLTSITVKGTVDKDEAVVVVGVIDASDYSVVSSIADAGIYMLPIAGFESLTLTAVGSADVVVKITEE